MFFYYEIDDNQPKTKYGLRTFSVQRDFAVIGIGITTQHLLVIKAEPLPVTQTKERIREREMRGGYCRCVSRHGDRKNVVVFTFIGNHRVRRKVFMSPLVWITTHTTLGQISLLSVYS